MCIINLLSGIANAISGLFKLKSCANRQRREAEQDVAERQAELEAKKAAIKEAVYSANDAKLNEIIIGLMQPVLVVCLTIGCLIAGCATAPTAVVYIPTDRRIESCTNSIGIACKAVPDAVFVDMLERLQELKAIKTEMAVDKRVR